jgi:hypothetical protein
MCGAQGEAISAAGITQQTFRHTTFSDTPHKTDLSLHRKNFPGPVFGISFL